MHPAPAMQSANAYATRRALCLAAQGHWQGATRAYNAATLCIIGTALAAYSSAGFAALAYANGATYGMATFAACVAMPLAVAAMLACSRAWHHKASARAIAAKLAKPCQCTRHATPGGHCARCHAPVAANV